jgi:hypothetical protein
MGLLQQLTKYKYIRLTNNYSEIHGFEQKEFLTPVCFSVSHPVIQSVKDFESFDSVQKK